MAAASMKAKASNGSISVSSGGGGVSKNGVKWRHGNNQHRRQ